MICENTLFPPGTPQSLFGFAASFLSSLALPSYAKLGFGIKPFSIGYQ